MARITHLLASHTASASSSPPQFSHSQCSIFLAARVLARVLALDVRGHSRDGAGRGCVQMGRPFKRPENAVRGARKLLAAAAAAVDDAEADIRRKHRPLKVLEHREATAQKRAATLSDAQAKLQQVCFR